MLNKKNYLVLQNTKWFHANGSANEKKLVSLIFE